MTVEGFLPMALGNIGRTITHLDLSANRLEDTIPTQIGQLRNLELFNVSRNNLDGTIQFSNFRRLKQLDVSRNSIRGDYASFEDTFPATLTFLDISGNQFAGPFPTRAIASMSNLVHLDLSATRLRGSIPPLLPPSIEVLILRQLDITTSVPTEIGEYPNLQILDFGFTDVTGTIPTEVGLLTNLNVLNFDNGEISGTIPTELGQAVKLRRFTASFTSLGGTIPSTIGMLTDLDTLVFNSNQITGSIPSEIGQATKLTRLVLNNNILLNFPTINFITGAIPSEIGQLSRLKLLRLNGFSSQSPIPTQLGNLVKLTLLEMASSSLTGRVPSEIGLLTRLERLTLRFNQFSSRIPSEFSMLTKLERFIADGADLTGTIPTEFESLVNIQTVDFEQNELRGQVPDVWCELEDFEGDVDCTRVRCTCCCPTPAPTTSPAPTAAGTTFVTLIILFGRTLEDNSWVLTDSKGETVEESGRYRRTERFERFTYRFVLEDSIQYNFTIKNSEGQGLGTGFVDQEPNYRLYLGPTEDPERVLICGDPNFGSEAVHLFVPTKESLVPNCLNVVPTTVPSSAPSITAEPTISPPPSPSPSLSTSPTSAPTKISSMSPSVSFSPTSGETVQVTLVIRLDTRPQTIAWNIWERADPTNVVAVQVGYDGTEEVVTHTVRVDSTTAYGLTFFDLIFRDGFCCDNGMGSFTLYLGTEAREDRTLVCGNAEFGISTTDFFVPNEENIVDCNADTLAPTSSPSASLAPTNMGAVQVTVVVRLVLSGGVRWTISGDDGTNFSSPVYGFDRIYSFVDETLFLDPTVSYNFTIFNPRGLGLVDEDFGDGTYFIFLGAPGSSSDEILGNLVVCGRPGFGFNTSHIFTATEESFGCSLTTEAPTASPSTTMSPTNEGVVKLTLVLMLDSSPEEILWGVSDANGEILQAFGPFTNDQANQTVEQSFFLDSRTAEYTLNVFDTGQDGLLSQTGNGFFVLYLGDPDDRQILVCGSPGFGLGTFEDFVPDNVLDINCPFV